MKKHFVYCFFGTTIVMACNNGNNQSKANKESSHAQHEAAVNSGYVDSVNRGLIVEDTMKKSVPRIAMNTIGATHVHITYSSPGVRGRIIWGGLVPYNTVWVTGAHAATKINFNNPIVINNKTINAGTYALFTIPGENEWIFILNKNYQQHLTDDYAEKDDVIRVAIKPQENIMTQRLTYSVMKLTNNIGNIEICWEKIKIVVPFKTAN